jgi:diguanylate cyclase (GGDEF)-like protein
MRMLRKIEPFPEFQNPDALLSRQLLEMNFWLIRIRWLYPFFILLYLTSHHYLLKEFSYPLNEIVLIFLLPFIGNLIFNLDLKKKAKQPGQPQSYDNLLFYASIQLDFDLVVLSLNVFFSGGLNSPVAPLFVFYVMVSTFLTDSKKAFRNTLTATVLIFLIAFIQNRELLSSQSQLTGVIALGILLFFTFFISAYLSKNLHRKERIIQDILKQTHRLSISDGLTGLFNQTYFFEILDIETKKAQRYNQIYSIIFLDVDYFKHYNDHNGHLLGSETLKRIGQIMKTTFRVTDILAKYGGDEFAIVLPQTDKVGAYLAAERLRENIEKEPFPGASKQPGRKITVSLGISGFPEHGDNWETILEKADGALYQAKESGRNRSLIYNDDVKE